jgi:hypothetical protein
MNEKDREEDRIISESFLKITTLHSTLPNTQLPQKNFRKSKIFPTPGRFNLLHLTHCHVCTCVAKVKLSTVLAQGMLGFPVIRVNLFDKKEQAMKQTTILPIRVVLLLAGSLETPPFVHHSGRSPPVREDATNFSTMRS